MKSIATLLLFGTFALLTACGGTSQDPLADQSAEVKAGHPPLGKPLPKELPMSSDVLKIDGPDYFVLHEGDEQEITIKSRALFGNAQYTLELTNADDFEGAVITSTPGDETTGVQASVTIKWKVPKGVAGSDVTEMKFAMEVYTTNFGENNFKVPRNFSVLVYSQSKSFPVVTKVVGPTTAVKENTMGSLKVYVTDEDAVDKDGSRPTLIFMPDSTSTLNATALLVTKTVVKDPAVPNGWIFDVTINLTNAELTPEMVVSKFYVAAYSRFNKLSSAVGGAFTIWTSTSLPISSWSENVTFKRLVPNLYTFSVTDPRGEGKISATFRTNCASFGATCSCKSVLGATGKANGAAQCTISWTPPAWGGWFSPGDQRFEVDVTNQSPVPGDTTKTQLTLSGVINLID